MPATPKAAPTVAARETRKPEFPATVHAYTDALRVMAEGPQTPEALAERTGRVASNVRRDVHKLRDAGVIEPAGKRKTADGAVDTWALTDKGRRWVTGIDVAEGKAPAGIVPADLDLSGLAGERGPGQIMPIAAASPPPAWPLDRIVRNPANRKVDPDSIPAMADSLVAQGQLQPVTLTPVRGDGNRMLLIGERRWLGALMAQEQGRLPESLAAGLRFEEREATPAEALAITVVENVERQTIPPLELAFLLRDYADAAGSDGKPLDAKSVAAALGLGHRDVQDKIRIARNASPEALARYEKDGSWDRLRDSVTERKAAVNGPDWVNGTPYVRRFDRRNPKHTAGDFGPDLDWPDDKWAALADPFDPGTFESFALLPMVHGFPTAQIQIARLRGGVGWVYGAGYSTSTVGHHETLTRVTRGCEAFPDRETAIAAGVDLIRDSLGGMNKNKLPAAVDTWLRRMESESDRPAALAALALADSDADPLVVNGHRYPNLTRANEARRAAGILPNPSNSGGGSRDLPVARIDPTLTQGEIDDAFATTNALADRVGKAGRDLPAFLNDNGLARLALIEIAHKIGDQRRPLDPISPAEWTGDVDEDFLRHGSTCGAYWLDAPVQALIQHQAARVVQIPGGHPAMLALTPEGLRFLLDYGCTLPITGAELVKDQKIAGVSVPQTVGRIAYATACLAVEPAAAATPDAVTDGPSEPADLWDRDAAAIAADEALLDRIRAFAGAEYPGPASASTFQAFADLWRALGFAPEVVITQAGTGLLANPIDPGEPVEIVTANADGSIPDQRASAIAWLVGWAVEQAFKAGADQ